jgi:hypothetical protein
MEGVDVSKLVSSLACFKHHFVGAISWSIDQDPKDRAIFGPFLICLYFLYCIAVLDLLLESPTLFQFFDSLYLILICSEEKKKKKKKNIILFNGGFNKNDCK